MKKVIISFWVLIITTIIFPQSKIDLIVYADNVTDSENVFISGNLPELGSWNAGLIRLNRMNDSTWGQSFYFNNNSQIQFKFTKGDWSNEALDENKKIPGNYNLSVGKDTTLSYRIYYWNNGQKTISGQVTGLVKYHHDFESKYVTPRDIIVWLPPDYDSLKTKRFPVLYMHDGQNIIDPETSSFGIDWQIDETADSLIKSHLIEEPIIVGIYNSVLRSKEYSNTPEGYGYINFIINELKPFIDATYRTLPDKINTANGGSSMGGLISFILAWEHPDIFSKAACLSPAFKIDAIDYVEKVKNDSLKNSDLMLYIDNGAIGLEQALQPGINEMLMALHDKGFKQGVNLLWINDPDAEHNESAWAKRVHNFLEFFFPKKK